MVIDWNSIEDHIPYYLTQEQKKGLVEALSDFNQKSVNFYIDKYPTEMFQGDGWSGLEVVDFNSGQRKQINGIIMSNTCDISPDNRREMPVKVIFAPIININSFAKLLRKAQLEEKRIVRKLQAIREQRVTTMFCLPKRAGGEEYVALLDDIHTIPIRCLNHNACKKLFTLSMVGFYIFLFKISVHFCRFHENVNR